jgi:hypothetical protein
MILNKLKTTAICASMLMAVSCTSDFNEINTNPTGVTAKELEQDFYNIKGPLAPMFTGIFNTTHWKYQLQQNLNADLWSGYMATPTPFAGGSNNSNYNYINGWNNFIWTLGYSDVMANALKVKRETKDKNFANEFYALSLVLKVEAMHRMTDVFGPIVYSKFGETTATIEYDSQQEVYNQMFAELDEAVAEFDKQLALGGANTIASSDISTYGGSYEQWAKYASSLRLRLAMRIVKINPALAKTQAEKAIAHGVMTSNKDICKLIIANYIDPLYTISESWGDIRMGADMESIMGGYNDPRLGVYFTKSADFPTKYRGVRSGIAIDAKSDRTGMSKLGPIVTKNEKVLMTTAEVYFLRAEGVLRGWNMSGTAEALYKEGVKLSFAQHGADGSDAYLADDVKMAADYVDPIKAIYNKTGVNNVTVAWNEAATSEVKLQKIITQKWIANFPEGQEAWSEYRRTGYPKLFKADVNNSGGTIDSNFGPRRINFAQSEKDGNPGGVATGVAKLGGPDNGGTRLWWDTTGPNF